MAEYRALAQNTFRFVHETVFNTVGDISALTGPLAGKAKVIIAGVLRYCPLECGRLTAGSVNRLYYYGYAYYSQIGNTQYAQSGIFGQPVPGTCLVDGRLYAGVTNATFFLYRRYTTGSPATLGDDLYFPAGTAKIIMYSATSGSIVTQIVPFSAAKSAQVTQTGSGAYAYQYAQLELTKTADDIILAIEIEYPKYDITLPAKVGMEYSTDDGVTFQALTQEVSLTQVEHIILKNTGSAAVNVGTTSGGSEVCTIPAGSTWCAVPEADGTLYIG